MLVFWEEVIDLEWGNYYDLKPAGYALFILLMIGVLLAGSYIGGRGSAQEKGLQSGTRQLVFSAMAIALAYAGSLIKFLKLPAGGSITLFSMLFIVLVGYWYGLRAGLTAAVAYGFLQLITDPFIVSIPQLLMDYIFGFGALGLSGLFANRRHGLILGYLTGVAGRFVFTFLSGMLFFADYAAGYHMALPLYSFLYNGSYLGLETVITVAIVAMPPVAGALGRVKQMAAAKL